MLYTTVRPNGKIEIIWVIKPGEKVRLQKLKLAAIRFPNMN